MTTGLRTLVEEDGPNGSEATAGDSVENSLNTMHPREWHLGLNWRCNADWPEGPTTTTGASAEEDEFEDLTMTTAASAADVEGTTRLRIWGRRRRLQCCNDRPEDLSTTAEEEETTTCLMERLRRRRRKWCDCSPGEFAAKMVALAEDDSLGA